MDDDKKYKMKHLLIILFILNVKSAYGQENRIDLLFNKFKEDIEIEQRNNEGRIVWDNETQLSYYLLLNTSPIDSLIKYTNDSNPAIRCQFFLGIAEKTNDDRILNEIISEHVGDSARFLAKSSSMIVIEYLRLIHKWKLQNELRIVDYDKEIERLLSEFHVIVPGARHGLISRNNLKNVNELICSKSGFKILSFTLTIGGKTVKSSCNILTKEMKLLIEDANQGEKLYLENLETEGPDKSIRDLGTITLKIQ